MTARLVNNPASALHREGEEELQHAIRAARVPLDPADRGTEDLATAA